jgi:hypothetical protein
METEQFNLVEYRRRNGFWTPHKTHIFNRNYAVCKSRKNELESKTEDPPKFYKIEKPKN